MLAGLSPRLRGNQRAQWIPGMTHGSIPAPAGEPAGPPSGLGGCAVYPRACGGTVARGLRKYSSLGLSPRLRGNPIHHKPTARYNRSIPAPAGEPVLHGGRASGKTVYPRACGGTFVRPVTRAWERGLSPRLRGNLRKTAETQGWTRSIPAPAGEPLPGARQAAHCRVYPRACGGTRTRVVHVAGAQGLSPRLRGNQVRIGVAPGAERSIPAPAGEPRSPIIICSAMWVYPRACGTGMAVS